MTNPAITTQETVRGSVEFPTLEHRKKAELWVAQFANNIKSLTLVAMDGEARLLHARDALAAATARAEKAEAKLGAAAPKSIEFRTGDIAEAVERPAHNA